MSNRQLAIVLRDAWKTFRLDAIREVVQRTIGDLEAMDPRQVLGREALGSELDAKTGSVRAALDTCFNELRDGCGLPTTPGQPIPPDHAAESSWSQTYASALEGYRLAACQALQESLGRAPCALDQN